MKKLNRLPIFLREVILVAKNKYTKFSDSIIKKGVEKVVRDTNDDHNFNIEIKKRIKKSITIKEKIIEDNIDVISKVVKKIIEAYQQGKKTIWFGNGGSAADAQHLACELVSRFHMAKRPAIPSLALTTNTSILTAVSNDFNFDNVFERQVEAFAEEGDVLIGITTSGTSANVIKALKFGKKKGTINVAFTGENISKIEDVVDYLVDVPSRDTPRIQEAHIMIGHIICDLVEKTLFGEK
ncbi:MAG: phosphoheptose isomerase [Thermoplasmata archaeon]|nr:MAG: phosphoheptose isomerase [Thermoplasmata archaeon]RLF51868.1 MAG: phosphoheptose isomerase [Thermoplasmata archaeon]